MLLSLSIRQLAIVEQLDLDFHSGMTIITGETGAGKSILLQALGLAVGDRATTDSLRHHADKAEVSASFDLKRLPLAHQWLAEQEMLSSNGQECMLRRIILASGRSKAFINGIACSVGQLKELGQLLLDIHGQHSHQSLLRRETHLNLLDEYAQLEDSKLAVTQAFTHYRTSYQQLMKVRQQDASQQAKVELLTYQVAELDRLAPVKGEVSELEAEQQELASVESLMLTGQQVLNLCDQDKGAALQQVSQAQQLLEQLDNPKLAVIKQLLQDASIQLEEASRELTSFIFKLEANPERLEYLEQRLNSYYQIAHKHAIQPEEVHQEHLQLTEELSQLSLGAEDIEVLEEEVNQLRQGYLSLANQLSQKRQVAAEQLEKEVTHQLAELGMEKSKFELSFTRLDRPQPNGLDQLEFLIAPNPGQAAKPLIRIASGGELSRISLAIQVVIAQRAKADQASSLPTLVFDEVDVGISGATAEIVGRLLKRLAQRGQIICVTHLPQVAAQGQQHLHLHKKVEAENTLSYVQQLDKQGRIEELARMLGGIQVSPSTLAHAEEMLMTASC